MLLQGPDGSEGLVTALMVGKTKLVRGMVMNAGYHSGGSLVKLGTANSYLGISGTAPWEA